MPGLSRVYYSNSGSEANEKVYKMVRQISHKHHNGKSSRLFTVNAITTVQLLQTLQLVANKKEMLNMAHIHLDL